MDTTTAQYETLSLYIGGRFLSARGRPEQDVINPATGKAFARLPHAREVAVAGQPRTAGQAQAFRRGVHGNNQTGVRRLRPLRRRLASVALPLFVELRFRNPCWRFRRIFDG